MQLVILAAAAVLFVVGCSSLGDLCNSDSDCNGDLVCFILEADGGAPSSGICTHPFSGPGGYCRLGADCAPALICSNELPSEVKRKDGRCIPLRDLAETCAADDQCRPPLVCVAEDENGTCHTAPMSDAGVD